MQRIKSNKFILPSALLGLAFAISIAFADVGYYSASGTGAVGITATCFNAIDSLIPDGTIVSVDTTASTSTNLDRIVVRPYAGTAITRPKCIGVTVGPMRRLGSGTILLWGFHPNAKMNASGIAANTMIKVSPATHGAFATVADSLSGQVGIFIGYNSRSTAANSRGKIFITAPLGRFFGSL